MTIKSKPLMIAAILGVLVLVQRLAPDTADVSQNVSLESESIGSSQMISGKVERVVDGDSLYVRGAKKQIRLWAVDAPEKSEAGYDAARDELKRLAYGKVLQCVVRDIDKYGRTVARCEDAQGRDINKAMLASGKAQEYCRFSRNYYGFCN